MKRSRSRLPLPDLIRDDTSFALVPEHSVDWHERDRLRQQRDRHRAEAELNQTRLFNQAPPHVHTLPIPTTGR